MERERDRTKQQAMQDHFQLFMICQINVGSHVISIFSSTRHGM